MVGVIIGGMKYKGEKRGEKNEVCGYLVDSEKWKGFGGIKKFFPWAHQNTISPNWRENYWKIFGQKCLSQLSSNSTMLGATFDFVLIIYFLGFLYFFFYFINRAWLVFIFFNNWAWLNQIDWVFAFIFFLIGQDFCFNKLGVIAFFFIFNWDFFNKDIWVNLYKLHFLSFHFSPQPNERVFHLSTLPSPH